MRRTPLVRPSWPWVLVAALAVFGAVSTADTTDTWFEAAFLAGWVVLSWWCVRALVLVRLDARRARRP